ncbi:MAG: hypothetical protein AAGG51_12360 [Cyanobacteria bacterium P01_G01_bin.54]
MTESITELLPGYTDLAKALLTLVILAFILERALVLVFEYRWYEQYLSGKGLKTPIAFGVAWFICTHYRFDVVNVLFAQGQDTAIGIFLTAAVAAGGSKGAISLFEGVLGLSKTAQIERRRAIETQAQAKAEAANANVIAAQADAAEAKVRLAKAQSQAAVRSEVSPSVSE